MQIICILSLICGFFSLQKNNYWPSMHWSSLICWHQWCSGPMKKDRQICLYHFTYQETIALFRLYGKARMARDVETFSNSSRRIAKKCVTEDHKCMDKAPCHRNDKLR